MQFRWGPVIAALAAITMCSSAYAQATPHAAPEFGRTVFAGWNASTDERYDDLIAFGTKNAADGSSEGVADEFSIECQGDTIVAREIWSEHGTLTATTDGTAELTNTAPGEGFEWRVPGCDEGSEDITEAALSGVPFGVRVTWTARGLNRPASYYDGASWGDCYSGHGEAGTVRDADASLDEFRGGNTHGWEQYAGEFDTVARATVGLNETDACTDGVRADLHGAHGKAAQRRAVLSAVRDFQQRRRGSGSAQAIPFADAGAGAGEVAIGRWSAETDETFSDVLAVAGADTGLVPTTGFIDVFHGGCIDGAFILTDYWTVDVAYAGVPMTSAQLSSTSNWEGFEVRWPDCHPWSEDEPEPVERDLTNVPISGSFTADQDGDTTPYTGQELWSFGACSESDLFGGLYRPATTTLLLQGSPYVKTADLEPSAAALVAGAGAGSFTYADSCGGFSFDDLHGRNGRAAQVRAMMARARARAR